MISYDLAKKLKDAGYPIRNDVNHFCPGCYCSPSDILPTLSELIEACGDRFSSLGHFKEDNHWEAATFFEGFKEGWQDRLGEGVATGSTPEEAVANLWLKLNHKT